MSAADTKDQSKHRMKTVILNGADADSPTVDELCLEVERHLTAQQASVRTFHLRHFAVGHCLGEFDCWVKTPGRCRIPDEGQEIERAVHDADLLIFLTPVSFGGYGAQLKKAVDRLIPLIAPFFEKRADLTHHQHRYERFPALVGIGWDATPSLQRERLFSAFVQSNALNLGSPAWTAVLVGEDRAAWGASVAAALRTSAVPGNASGSLDAATRMLQQMASAEPALQPFTARPKVAILLGSARAPGTSTSESLAHYFEQQLQHAGATVEVLYASAFARDPVTAARAAHQLASAEVLVVAAPLYVDSLPYLAVLALQQVRALRRAGLAGLGGPAQPTARLVGLLNCGFPEPEQLRFALGLLREFAAESHYTWAGALAVGGGEAIHGRPLESTGGMTLRLRHALDAAAAALCAGEVVPDAASGSAAHPFIAPALYRLAGWWGWRSQGRAHGLSIQALRQRPFDTIDDAQWERMAASGAVPARPLRVVEKIPEGADAVTLVFDDPAHHRAHFEAGQYLTLELPIAGDRVRRAYSLSGAPCDGELSITVKRVPGGLASNWIHDQLEVGQLVRSFGPSGTFTAGTRPANGARHLLLVAGGSGIVPLAVIAREVLHTEADAKVTLIYGSASLQRAIFAAPLRQLAQQYGARFTLQFVFETPPPDGPGLAGRLDAITLGRCLANQDAPPFQRAMVCGPDGMRASVRQVLQERGFSAQQIVEENFASPRRADGGHAPQLATLLTPDAAQQTMTVEAGQTLLEAALNAGVAISFSCCSGGCGACRVHIAQHAENITLDEPNKVTADERERGEVPACLVRLRGPIGFSLP